MNYLIITAHHDYRTPRRASIHFIADELKNRGSLKFFSLRYSILTQKKGDIRSSLDAHANTVTDFNGAKCFLWKTAIHPFNFQIKIFQPLENFLFWIYKNIPHKTLEKWVKDSDVIIYESGIAPIFFERLKKINPAAKHIYRASDDLETIKTADYAKRNFSSISGRMDAVCLVSKSMAENILCKNNLYHVPHGINEDLGALGTSSPYGPGTHAVSVGSMLFDPSYFEVASHAFPNVTFHVIGSGSPHRPTYGKNVILYGHMAYSDTIRYIKHAHIGISPYISEDVPVYLADSSLKMLQYDFFALPTVCPQSVTGSYASRFGYTPGDAASIIAATDAALAAPHLRTRHILTWQEAVDRLLEPSQYDDTKI